MKKRKSSGFTKVKDKIDLENDEKQKQKLQKKKQYFSQNQRQNFQKINF